MISRSIGWIALVEMDGKKTNSDICQLMTASKVPNPVFPTQSKCRPSGKLLCLRLSPQAHRDMSSHMHQQDR
ncbi:hypothetical protein TNIN_491321 [Trichonephila inaurata madagascariensis]|uniref:Uncharacterized protein n=1 Tax=Trichonephila inaurata madagascariensis TaxID=2747483 RepID=A0A8X6XGI2_9ARAC|nr:hypothetical protein TNIN_491321 [Trichonephila inaurata madagascariensis]